MIIDGERKLCTILQSINHRYEPCVSSRAEPSTNIPTRFTLEVVEEGYRFAHGNVVIHLTRFLKIPLSAQEWDSDGRPKVNSSMPPYEKLSPFDEENKWVLMAKVDLTNGNDQDLVRKGTEELLALKADLEGLFDFQVKDRLIFDTRVRS
jgi:mediator of RNA polymerase II transcription subunit 18